MITYELIINQEGLVFIHDDNLALALESLGTRHDERASHVEPDPEKPGMWRVDLSPIGEEKYLGPFKLRREALSAEHDYIQDFITRTCPNSGD